MENAIETPVVEATSTSQNESEAVVETTEEPKVFDADYVSKLRSEAAKYRTQAKELAEKAKKFDIHEQSQKSEQEKLTDDLRAATESREQLESELLRMKVASSKNLPASLVGRLHGNSVEELEADADTLLADLKSQFVERQKSTPEQTGAGVVGGAEDASIEGFLDMLRKQS